jgi:predicted DNA-binding protein
MALINADGLEQRLDDLAADVRALREEVAALANGHDEVGFYDVERGAHYLSLSKGAFERAVRSGNDRILPHRQRPDPMHEGTARSVCPGERSEAVSATVKKRRRYKRPPQPGQPIVSAGLGPEKLRLLRVLAQKTDRSVSDLVREALDARMPEFLLAVERSLEHVRLEAEVNDKGGGNDP